MLREAPEGEERMAEPKPVAHLSAMLMEDGQLKLEWLVRKDCNVSSIRLCAMTLNAIIEQSEKTQQEKRRIAVAKIVGPSGARVN